jgi:hypothetical protein
VDECKPLVGGSAAVTDEPFNEPAIEFLKRLPGITEANYR